MTEDVLAGGLAAAVAAAVALALLIPLLRRSGVLDIPVERSLHAAPIARGAGTGWLIGAAAGVVIALTLGAGTEPPPGVAFPLGGAAAAVVAFAGIGLADDVASASPLLRLILQVGAAGVVAIVVLVAASRSLIWVPILALVLVAMVNVTNFMDGANGLLGLHGLVAGGWYGVLAVLEERFLMAAFAAAAAGALLGFLPFNVPRAKAFLGDVGSYGIGASWGVLFAWALLVGVPFEAAAAPLLVFVADTAYTLQLRLRAGQRWYQPHKLHVYQRLVAAGWSHLASSGLVAGVAILCSLLALPAVLGAGAGVRAACVAGMAVVCVLYLRLPVWVGAPEPWHQARLGAIR